MLNKKAAIAKITISSIGKTKENFKLTSEMYYHVSITTLLRTFPKMQDVPQVL